MGVDRNMRLTKIKLCGLSREQDIEYVNEALPDYAGFVFAESRRQITADTAYRLKALLDKRISSVGVFVNEDMAYIRNLCFEGVIDYVQLHGDEDNHYIQSLLELLSMSSCSKPIIKAVRVKDEQAVVLTAGLPVDYLLLDTYSESAYGGTGTTFDWKLAASAQKPFFLAGGLNSQNVVSAIAAAQPYCVDISSGVESNGVKDGSKIKNIVKLIRSVE